MKILPTCIILVCLGVTAAQAEMTCKTLSLTMLDGNGKLMEFKAAPPEMLADFTVDTGSGRTTGGLWGNESYAHRELLDTGSRDSAFKVIATSPRSQDEPFVNVSYLQIQMYEKNSPRPFIGVQGHLVATGTCQ